MRFKRVSSKNKVPYQAMITVTGTVINRKYGNQKLGNSQIFLRRGGFSSECKMK